VSRAYAVVDRAVSLSTARVRRHGGVRGVHSAGVDQTERCRGNSVVGRVAAAAGGGDRDVPGADPGGSEGQRTGCLGDYGASILLNIPG
jgi:hypothetical protein